MPKAIRSDNGEPFGVPTRDVVPFMSLWLKAWGITPILNRPRRPTDNPKVERGQGCLIQREKYRVVRLGNVTRGQLHKSLFEKPRPFEEARFEEKQAYQYLALAAMPRKVSSNGTIIVYGKVFSIGPKHKGKVVIVKFNPTKLGGLSLNSLGQSAKHCPTLDSTETIYLI